MVLKLLLSLSGFLCATLALTEIIFKDGFLWQWHAQFYIWSLCQLLTNIVLFMDDSSWLLVFQMCTIT